MFRYQTLSTRVFRPLATKSSNGIHPTPLIHSHSVPRFYAILAKPGKVTAAIKTDHRQLEDYYRNIVNSTDTENQIRFQNAFVWELARHSVAEEIVVYPAFEKYISNGKEIADHDRAEHQKVKEQLFTFQKLSPSDPAFMPTIKELYENLSAHIKEEEDHDLPALEEAISAEDSQSIANSFERTKSFVPTRSHPSAPNKPPFETAAGLMTAPIDKLMDLFHKFPKDHHAKQ